MNSVRWSHRRWKWHFSPHVDRTLTVLRVNKLILTSQWAARESWGPAGR